MKRDKKYRVLSLRYSVISVDEKGNETPTNHAVKRVFIAESKKGLMKKLKAFEEKMLAKKKESSIFARIKSYVASFSKKCKHFHQESLQL